MRKKHRTGDSIQRVFLSAIFAGICIGIGGTVYLSVESKVLGAVLFTVGLFLVCTFGLNLYTGKVCYILQKDREFAMNVPVIWLGNLLGTWGFGTLMMATRSGSALSAKAAAMCAVKLNDSLLSIFLLAVCCNCLIYIGVEGYNTNPHEIGKYLALFFGVVVFILAGFEHCVANMFYFTVAGVWNMKAMGYLLVMTLGNAVGGIAFAQMRQCLKKS